MKLLHCFLLIITFLTCAAFAGTVTHHLNIPAPRIDRIAPGDRVILDEAMSTGRVGDPCLPVWGLNILLPPGEEAVNVSLMLGAPVSLGGDYHIPPVQSEYPLSYTGRIEADLPNSAVYEKDTAFPANLVAQFRTDFYRGYGIAAIALNPVTYNPVSGELVYYPDITVVVNSAASARAAQAYTKMLKRSSATLAELSATVDNPADISQYGGIDDSTDEPYFDILLITAANMVEFWDEYIDWKAKCGYYVAVETVQDICSTYPGVDDAEKMRNCVIDYYQNFDLSYVFLAGDAEICYPRYLWASSTDIPGDVYFAGLDGNWNADGDNHWGEPEEADLRMEIGVSRATVDSRQEIENFVSKQKMYMMQPVVDEVETALMVGEDLGWNVWGYDYKEEVRTGNSSWGFITAPFPPNFNVGTLYDRPGFSFSAMNDLLPLMNQGPIYINHMGHAFYDYMLKFSINLITAANFTNNGTNHNFYLIYSQGCLCGGFDYNNYDCITEVFSTMATGPVCVISNARYGWGNVSSTQGSSQYYDKQFFDAIWGENITIASKTQKDAKEDNIPFITYQYNRYVYYESNLFCEPTLDLWTTEPQILSPSYAGEIFLGADSFQVTVPGVENARVCLSKDGVIHSVGFTNAAGVCNLVMEEPLLSLGTADLYVTAHNYLPHQGSVLVLPPTGAYVIFDSLAVDDQQGNNNGVWDYGETTYLDMTLENAGLAGAVNVSSVISSADSLVTIIDSTAFFGDISQSSSATVDNAYTVMVSGAVEDGTVIPFVLNAACGTSSWESYFSLQVSAPQVYFAFMEIDDSTGNNNGCLDPGESAVLIITLINRGSCYTSALETVLSSNDPYITITSGAIAYGTILPGEEAAGSFNLTVAINCPQEHTVDFTVNFSEAIGYSGSDDFSTIVGDITYLPTGPDAYGYSAYDPNDLPVQPVYQWVEISADSGGPGTLIPFTQDDQVMFFPLPFNFTYYGLEYDSLTISSDGYLALGLAGHDDHSNSAIPAGDGPSAMIAAYWEDLSPQRQNSGKVWQWFDEPNHLYIVEYNHIEQFSPLGSFETFQVLLYDPVFYQTLTGDGQIKMQYKSMSGSAQTEGTIGIENPAETTGLQYFFDGSFNANAMPMRNGLCIFYTTVTELPPLQVSITPQNPPIIIPPQGGSFQYLMELANAGNLPLTADIWIMVTLPDSSQVGPVFSRMGINMLGGAVISRNMTQSVPASAPAGLYLYTMYGGNYNNGVVYSQDSFEFSKSGMDLSGLPGNWSVTGWDEEITAAFTSLPEKYELYQNYPNPFNPVTTISYTLPESGHIKLTVYNSLGQELATLLNGWQTQGFYNIELDATNWSSGIYFYRLQAGNFSQMRKMVLLK